MAKALEGLKVVEIGNILAGPFAATLMADFGADVIKVEDPKGGDLCRNMGRIKDMWFAVEGRNKQTVSLNLKDNRGKELLWQLLQDADVLVENFRPGVFAKMGFTWEKLHKYNPKLIFMSASGFGQTGPYSHKPGFDRIGLAMGGLLHITGFPDGPPIKPGLSIADFFTAMFGALGIMFAVYNRDVIGTGIGQRIDCSLSESILRILESIIPEYSYDGFIRERVGNGTLVSVPSGHFLTKDGQYLVLSVVGDKLFADFAKAIGREDIIAIEEYKTGAGRTKNRDQINNLTAEWASSQTIDECLQALGDVVPNCKVYTVEDIIQDPHFAAREMIVDLETKKFGKIKMQGIVPKMSGTPGEIRWIGPDIGEFNATVYCEKLGLSEAELKELQKNGVI